MPTYNCKDCGGVVAYSAKRCPRCASTDPYSPEIRNDAIAEKAGKVVGITGLICGILIGFVAPGSTLDERALHAVIGATFGLFAGWAAGVAFGKLTQLSRADWIAYFALAVLVIIVGYAFFGPTLK